MTTDYNSKAYRRSRGAYKAQCTFEYFISILAADAFLAKLLTEIGVSDAATGVISSLVSFSFLFQFVSLTFADRLKRVKRTVMVFDTASQLLFMSIYFVPFLPGSVRFRTALITAVLLAAYFCMYVILSICYKWGNSFVEPGRRGQYSAAKEMISLASGVVFTLAVGFTVDRFEAAGNLRGAFLFLAGSMFAVCCCNFGSFLLMADRENLTGGSRKSFREMLAHTLGCRPYRNAVILACLWDAARYMTVGFLGTFKTNDLAMTVGTVQVINTAASLGRFAVSRPFGRYSDRHTYAGGFRVALYLAAAGFAFNMFAAPASKWCLVVFTVLYHMSLAGTNQNNYNMTYCYTEEDYVVHGLAVNDGLRGIVGFLSSLAGSRILSAAQHNGNRLFGIPLYGQQALSFLSLLLTLAAIAFNKAVVAKQKENRK